MDDLSVGGEVLWGDSSHLRQVFINLIGNALKVTEQDRVTLRVESLPRNDGKLALKFSVTDTGIGISQEAQKNIFGAFSEADASTTKKFVGTGLGLAISRKLVELMGGELSVESMEGRGSTFGFSVEFELSEDSLIEPEVSVEKASVSLAGVSGFAV